MITDDTGGFLEWESDGRASGGWYLFRSPDGKRELRVKNINFKAEETATGADLVYVRSDPECVVLVQYKLLTSNADATEYFVRDSGGRLGRQVTQMLSFSTTQASNAHGDDNYRIGSDIGFVKFVVPAQPGQSSGRLVIPAGRYHPAEGVLRMLAHPSKGPKSGNIHLVDEWRSLDGETFARLVRDQWVGSNGAVSDALLAVLGLARNPLYLAVEEAAQGRWTSDSSAPRTAAPLRLALPVRAWAPYDHTSRPGLSSRAHRDQGRLKRPFQSLQSSGPLPWGPLCRCDTSGDTAARVSACLQMSFREPNTLQGEA